MFYKFVTPGKQLILFSVLKRQYTLVKILLKLSNVRYKMSLSDRFLYVLEDT